MSRCVHDQSTCQLRKLPRCSRCSVEFNLVVADYNNQRKPIFEWECPKCHKIVTRELLREEQPSPWEQFLKERLEKRHATDNKSFGRDSS